MADSPSITRRRVLASLAGASVATAALAVPVAAALGPDADAELLAFGAEFERLYASENAAKAHPDDDSPSAWDAWDEAYKRTNEVVRKIEGCRATTLEGLRVKARAIEWCHGTGFEEFDGDTTDMRLGSGIVRDLLNT